MISRPSPRACSGVALLALTIACSDARDPIVVEEGSVLVENQTGSDWKDVRIVVNDHYNGGVPTLRAGQRLNAPLSQFQSGLGYRYDRGRMSPYKVEVTATDSRGHPVNLMWGANKTAK
jgi:hypothetical protein